MYIGVRALQAIRLDRTAKAFVYTYPNTAAQG
jgi:hypothetical protein